MISVSYEFYKTTYFGDSLDETEFPKLCNKAGIYVDRFTFDRASSVTDSDDVKLVSNLKQCICEVAEKLKIYNASNGMIASSETVGSWTVSYAAGSIPKSAESDIYKTVSLYLGSSNLMYMGI